MHCASPTQAPPSDGLDPLGNPGEVSQHQRKRAKYARRAWYGRPMIVRLPLLTRCVPSDECRRRKLKVSSDLCSTSGHIPIYLQCCGTDPCRRCMTQSAACIYSEPGQEPSLLEQWRRPSCSNPQQDQCPKPLTTQRSTEVNCLPQIFSFPSTDSGDDNSGPMECSWSTKSIPSS